TLKSWAVPKGLAPRPGIKRLAVTTEDHPLEYLNFDGTIPKGQYGGGEMWIFAQGKYEFTKEKKDGFYFRLNSRELNAEYRMYQTRGNEWLLERVDAPQVDWLRDRIEPMLANSDKKPPTSGDYLFEVKWDGIRATIVLDEGQMRIISRGHRDVSKQFPELLIPEKAFRGTCAVFDTEIVCLDEDGRPSFKQVINRLMQRSASGIERGRQKHPVVCYVFDCLYLDGRPILQEPLTKRREWLADAIRKDSPYRVSEAVDDGQALFEAAKALGLEGIVAKDRTSPYLPGKRSNNWLKIKTRQTMDCLIIGYTKGKGDRGALFGALHIGEHNGDGLEYRGKVGTGYDQAMMKSIFSEIQKLQPTKRMIKQKPLDDAQTVWIEPKLLCEVQYSSLTKDGMLREPVFLRLRPDLMEE
ncbi:MAG TPA: non-homologous end-joining DNA ligase, partial [bacterium]